MKLLLLSPFTSFLSSEKRKVFLGGKNKKNSFHNIGCKKPEKEWEANIDLEG
jgi:hypothetical protein